MSWPVTVAAHHGRPATECDEDRRYALIWVIDGVEHSVAIERDAGGPWRVAATGAAGTVTWTGEQEPSDGQVRHMCVIVGLLPSAYPEFDRATEASEAQTIADRDRYRDVADQLADVIARITGAEVGEHSSMNNPWDNALAAAEVHLRQIGKGTAS